MIKNSKNPLITKAMIVPSNDNLIVKGSLNPGATEFEGDIILLLRIAEGCKAVDGKISVPVYRFENNRGNLEVLHFDESDPDIALKDNRAVIHKGKEYVSTLSHLRLARSKDGVNFTVDEKPFLVPQNESEEFGVEDARIVKIDDCYYINYTAVSKDSYGTSLIRTNDFVDKHYMGMIFCAPNKDVCIFPEKINGRYFALHRPYNHDFGKSSIWLAESPDLVHWGNHRCLIRPRANKWEDEKIGAGAPPIKTDAGWLEIYHGKTLRNGKDFYSLMVLLLDLNDPTKVIYRGDHPILMPEESYETNGFVPNVVFLNGMVIRNKEDLLLYYSACDDVTCLAECKLNELIPFIK
ncbi:MAG: glycoside hydrolase family 130 protein [Deltaproteobacteria bacterium]|nr:glycoside hydrolase family 130 protein [Deltaproteobacteria bacterium]MBW1870796.1 glycoside hydrolase family 130 protein [Deltaproteobacteria bacterium]